MPNAIITASTKGIGRATALALAQEGINLAICSRNEHDLSEFKAELLSIYPTLKVFTAVADCSMKKQVLDFASAAEKALAGITIIVNNAGLYQQNSILDDNEDAFENQLNTNLMPAYQLYRYFGKKLIAARNGHIFNICSVASLLPVAQAGMYSVTKFALLGLNKVMRAEMQPYGVKVTAVIPGSTLTDSWKGLDVAADQMVLPGDIAAAIVNTYKMSAGANVDEIIITPAFGQI